VVIETIDNPATSDQYSSRTVIETALSQLKSRARMYELYHAYYEGVQPLTFTSDKYDEAFSKMVSKYTENMCPAVVDAVADRLRVTGFSVDESKAPTVTSAAEDIWRRNRMDELAGQVHTEALKEGDAYVIVWPDVEDTSLIRIWPQDANGITCYWDEETNELEWAAKWWIQDEDKLGRLTLYFPDRIERYITNSKVNETGGFVAKATAVHEYAPTIANPYGRVPVFHFANNARISKWGKSELQNIIPVQDALNKSVCDMLVAMEFAAFPQRWATGIQVKTDPITGRAQQPWKSGVDRLWATGAEDASFGQFEAADLSQYIAAQTRFKEAIADISGTPQHYIQMASSNQRWPSGEALKTAEYRFVSKVTDRQISFGNTWEDVMSFALSIQNKLPAELTISTEWQDASPRTDQETASVGVLKQSLGVPQTQIWREMGYSEDDIVRMTAEKQQQDEASMQRQVALFQRGAPGDSGSGGSGSGFGPGN